MIYGPPLKNTGPRDLTHSRLLTKCRFHRPLFSGFPPEVLDQRIGQKISEWGGGQLQLNLVE